MVACTTAAPAPKPEPGYIAAPVVAAASPITLAHTAPVATSYANTYKVSYKSPVIAAAPLVATAPSFMNISIKNSTSTSATQRIRQDIRRSSSDAYFGRDKYIRIKSGILTKIF
ncbi:hypothetical protein PV325_002028 [Microctonus aethiopoides]|uniref:Uncharacterized protein n=1 Tax=Microctonus aethiopoides TaxID=144406 RepID=A0AA39FHS7_9HYME|nr:hypothetical protein PV325_002028 [Microctonus aethiopoides]KAK0092781.1 hypothetical protein PV326_000615 [Microctonus aethiopoides]KAK0169715.1 hypothetical protein PV328_010359 [Microctonus aethiopoides]